MTIAQFDQLPVGEKRNLLFSCCGSESWVNQMLEIFPVNDLIDLLEYAEEKWFDCNPADWLEAFENHARLGDKNALQNELSDSFSINEQARLLTSENVILQSLSDANEDYEETFGYMFISYAQGKTAETLLAELEERLRNDPREEIKIAAAEQDKITKSRLRKLFS